MVTSRDFKTRRGKLIVSILGSLLVASLLFASAATAGLIITSPVEDATITGTNVWVYARGAGLDASTYYRFTMLKFDGDQASFSHAPNPFETDSDGNFAERYAGAWNSRMSPNKTADLVLMIQKGHHPPGPSPVAGWSASGNFWENTAGLVDGVPPWIGHSVCGW